MNETPCPRCGYDQSGIMATWEQSCPLESVCSECGLEIQWAEVLSAKFAPPAWSFEHTRRIGVLPIVETLGRACRPPLLWRQLKLTHAVVTRRLLILVVLVVAMGHLAAAGAGAAAAYRRAASAPPTPVWTRVLPPPGGTGIRWTATGTAAGPNPGRIAIAAAIWPYGMDRLWTLVPINMRGSGAVVHDPAIELLVFAIAIPPGFLILGDTMRKCKVLKRHLLRGAVYSLAMPLIMWVVDLVWVGVTDSGPWRFGFFIGAAWLVVYWTVFVRDYLRLTHAGGVVIAMLTMAGLLTLIVATVNYTRHLGWQ